MTGLPASNPRKRLRTDADRAEYWKGTAYHYECEVAKVQRALESWRRDPEACIRRIAEIVGYYIA